MVADWDRFTDGDTDDDGGHIIDDYGVEEMPALVSDAQLVSDSYADWLAEGRPSREVHSPAQLKFSSTEAHKFTPCLRAVGLVVWVHRIWCMQREVGQA